MIRGLAIGLLYWRRMISCEDYVGDERLRLINLKSDKNFWKWAKRQAMDWLETKKNVVLN